MTTEVQQSDKSLAPRERELKDNALTILEKAKALQIGSQEDYDGAGQVRREILKPLRLQIESYHEPLKRKAREAWQAIVDAEKGLLAPVDEADRILEGKRIAYYTEQEEKRKAEERRLAEVAAKEAEDRRVAEAAAAEKQGVAPEDLDAILSTPDTTPPPVAQPTVIKTTGISIRTRWKCVLEGDNEAARQRNLLAVVKYVAKNPHLLGMLEFCAAGANKIAGAQKALLKVPGTRVYEDRSEAVR